PAPAGHLGGPHPQPAAAGVYRWYFLRAVPVALAAGGADALPADRVDLAEPRTGAGAGGADVVAELPLCRKSFPLSRLDLPAVVHAPGVHSFAVYLDDPVVYPACR